MPFDTTLDPTTDVILGAITYYENHDWHKGGLVGPHGATCIVQAMRQAAGSHSGDLVFRAIRRVQEANGIKINLPFWNDARDRTKEQVLDALRNSLGRRE